MAGDIRKEIKFVADITSLQESMRQIGPMLKQLEDQMRLNIPIQPSIIDPNTGQPFRGMPTGPQQPTFAQLKQSPAYQLLQMQESLKGRTDRLDMQVGGKTPTEIMQERLERARSGGKMTEITSIEKLVEGSKGLDKRFNELTKTIDELDKRTKALTEEEMKQAIEAKRELSAIQKQRSEILSQSAGVGGGAGGAGGFGGLGMAALRHFGPLALMSGAVRAADWGFELPMRRAAARGTTGALEMRNIEAMLNPTSFENIARMEGGMQETAQSAAKWSGTWRGASKGVLGSMGWGAGLGTAASVIAAPFTGGASLAALPWFIGGGAALGGLGQMGSNIAGGEIERQRNLTFEERMASEMMTRGPEAARMRALMGVQGSMAPVERAFGMGFGRMGQFMRGTQGMFQRYGMGIPEYAQTMMGAAPIMGEGPSGDILNTTGRIMRGTGLSGGEVGAGFAAFSAVGTANSQQAKVLEEIMARGVARGYNNAPLAKQYLEVLNRVAGAAAGGFGATGAGAIGAMMNTVQETYGGPATMATATGAASAMAAMDVLGTSKAGVGGMAAGMAANDVVSNLLQANPKLSRGKAMAIARMMMDATQQELTQNVDELAHYAGVDPGIMRGIIGRFAKGRIENMGNIMGSLTGDTESGMALAMKASGVGLTAALKGGRLAGPTAEKWMTAEMFQGGTGAEFTKGEGIIDKRVGELANLPEAIMQATGALRNLSTAFSEKTVGEMATRLQKLNEGFTDLSPEASKMAIYFQMINEQAEAQLIREGMNPKEMTNRLRAGPGVK